MEFTNTISSEPSQRQQHHIVKHIYDDEGRIVQTLLIPHPPCDDDHISKMDHQIAQSRPTNNSVQQESPLLQHNQQKQHSISYDSGNQKSNDKLDTFYILSTLPMVFLTWIQFAFNLSVMLSLFYMTYRVFIVLRSDLDKHIEKQSQILLGDMIQCSRDYLRNNCNLKDVPPALEPFCNDWKACFEQDTKNIIQSQETAVLLAQVLNRFFDSLSDRTIYSCATLFIGSIFVTNFMLSWSRIRSDSRSSKNSR